MLPNRMQLSKSTEEQLKKLKAQTGITPNISARIAFFRSIESGYLYDFEPEYKTDGSLTLDKITWLGKTQAFTELLLSSKYPLLDSKQLQLAWATHVEHGISSLKTQKNLPDLLEIVYK
ncbi:DNA sulfur modification protein DndE [Alteromonas aestuariivivens]|uniref:DNA sulfur modification protein DndE n=1 Tax=Alteromonas aestuariivivens TaxID=1938339 RepID=A0A3D8M2R6_9ALTE|nr:DNA sulfur modification protein DndE [Alteromonas aestuariivivens]RDV23906.1 DNA sulfur modification protein DndE [Alteromonas aestuariivivens]